MPSGALTTATMLEPAPCCSALGTIKMVVVGIAATLTVVVPTETALPSPAIVHVPAWEGVQLIEPNPWALMTVCCDVAYGPDVNPIVTG